MWSSRSLGSRVLSGTPVQASPATRIEMRHAFAHVERAGLATSELHALSVGGVSVGGVSSRWQSALLDLYGADVTAGSLRPNAAACVGGLGASGHGNGIDEHASRCEGARWHRAAVVGEGR
jgi:hypothetical protein